MKIRSKLPRVSAAGLMVAVAVTAAFSVPPVLAAETVAEMFTQGKGALSFRYRLEFVDQANFDDDAVASTLRTRLNFRTDDWNGFGVFAEFDYVTDIFSDDYNAGGGNTPDKGRYPVVADPTGSDLNQAYVQWQGSTGSLLRGGRQRIIFDNARFVGNVGWRQNEQTYDAGYFQQKTAAGLDFQLAYVWQVNRIFGRDVPAGTNDNSTWLTNLGWVVGGLGKLTGYFYDIDNVEVADFSTSTWGARLAGSNQLGSGKFGYAAEFAHQNDAHNNPVDYSANYYRLDVSMGIAGVTPYAGFESLGGDNSREGAAFRTPLATLHAFNGWADVFLTTPPAGLNDLFVGIKGSFGGSEKSWGWEVLHHTFEAESGGADYGDEIDASLSRKFAGHYGLLLKAAWFDADSESGFADTTKFWIQLTADF